MCRRLMIAGTGSGCGKTTVTCALLSALSSTGKDVCAFKCGPDYIDPTFHKKASGVECRNLDVYIMGENGVKLCLGLSSAKKDIALLEGVMGFYDGVYDGSCGSSSHISLLTETPVILVVNPKGTALSLCAVIKGFLEFSQNNISGVILNNVSEAMFGFYKELIEKTLNVAVLGFMPYIPEAEIPSRHLGLVTAEELADIRDKLKILGQAALKYIDINRLMEVTDSCAPVKWEDGLLSSLLSEGRASFGRSGGKIGSSDASKSARAVKIYASRDEAFSFCYEDNYELLRALGAEIDFFSPLRDSRLPKDADGVLLWGGYPELYAKKLQNNIRFKNSLKAALENGLPVYAECGGFMYLQQSLTDFNGETHQMLGFLPGHAKMTEKLQTFGYCQITAQKDNMLCKKGESINAHFFRRSVSDVEGDCFVAAKKSGKTFPCVAAEGNVFAGYQHLHFWGNISFAKSFIKACARYGKNAQGGR